MKRIGIMGGTFDPPHLGHLYIAKAAYERTGLDGVLFLPNGTPAYKTAERRISPKEDRCRMVELLIGECPWCEMSLMECEREGNTYTADTLAQLTAQHPDIAYELIVGSDSFQAMEQWYHPERIFAAAGVIVLLRDADTESSLKDAAQRYEHTYGAGIRVVACETCGISSTQIRKLASAGKSLEGLVPESVEQYIVAHQLYK